MTTYGLKLMSELRDARTLVDHALAAEQAGFGFVAISDHIHPWLPEQQHSPFAWSVLGAVAARAPSLELATGVTCPTVRYHPVLVAHAAATVASMSDRPFTLGLGSGERLNEHVTGSHFPPVDVRHEMLAEAIPLMRQLWSGEWTTIRGRHFTADHVRIYDLPEQPIQIVVAAGGEKALDLAHDSGADGVMGSDPDPSVPQGWVERGGDPAATWSEVPFAWAPTAEEGLRLAHERFRFSAPGWKVMAELPNPAHFAAACESVRPEDLASSIPHGPDPQRYVEALQQFREAGFERVSIIPVGDDLDGLLRFWEQEVRPALN